MNEKEKIIREIIASWLLNFGDTPMVDWAANKEFTLCYEKYTSRDKMADITGFVIWVTRDGGYILSEEAKKWFLKEQVSKVDNHET